MFVEICIRQSLSQCAHSHVIIPFRPDHSISFKIACAPNENSDQPAYLHSLVSVCPPEEALDHLLLKEYPCEYSDAQADLTFAGRRCNLVGKPVPGLIFPGIGKSQTCRQTLEFTIITLSSNDNLVR